MYEKRSIWFGFIGSFSPKFYKGISHQSFGRSFGYLILLVLAVTLVLSVKYTFDTRGAIQKGVEWINTDFAEKLPEILPEINIINGEASSPAEQPLIHEWEVEIPTQDLEKEKIAFIFDTTGTITSLDGYSNGVLITKHKMVFKYKEAGRSKIEEFEFKDVKSFKMAPGKKEREFITFSFEGQEFSLTEETIEKWANIAEKIVFPGLVVILFIYYLIAKLFQLLLFSLLSLIINSVKDAKLNYDNLLNIGVFAMTPPVVFAVLAGVLGLKIPLFWLLYIGLYSIFLIMAIRQFKTISPEER